MGVESRHPYLSGPATHHQAHSETSMGAVVLPALRVLSIVWGVATATDTVFVQDMMTLEC